MSEPFNCVVLRDGAKQTIIEKEWIFNTSLTAHKQSMKLKSFHSQEAAQQFAERICRDPSFLHVSVSIRDPNMINKTFYHCYSYHGIFGDEKRT